MRLSDFWANVAVTKSGCWEWTGSRSSFGYGVARIDGTGRAPKFTHRLSYEMARGAIPEGLHVCHACDNPPCLNPDHLWIGTHADNMNDKVAKQRHPRGSSHGYAKLTEPEVLEIRRRYASGGVSQVALAADFGVSQITVSRIVRGEAWHHLIRDDYLNGRPA